LGKLLPTIVGLALFIALGFLPSYMGVESLPEWFFTVLFVVPPFIAGLIAREVGDGAASGFLTLFLPILGLGIIVILNALNILNAPVSGALVGLITTLIGIIALAIGILVIVASFIFGITGAIIGGLGGFISNKLSSKGGT